MAEPEHPGLSVLFAPTITANLPGMGSDDFQGILGRLSELSEVVVVDLPPSLSAADQTILAESDTVALVVERDALFVVAPRLS